MQQMQVFITENLLYMFRVSGQRPSANVALLGHAGRRSLPQYVIWPVPEAVVTIWYNPYDGVDGRPKHVE